jgi:AraC-like DNA-binding protein
MSDGSLLDMYRFTTVDEPGAQRFDAWAAAISTCEYERPENATVPFDAEFHATRFGPFMLAGRRWLLPDQQVDYRTIRSTRKIRSDQIDHYHLVLQLTGGAVGEWAHSTGCTRAGGLYLFDMNKPFDCMVTTGNTIGLVIPRDLFQSLDLKRYGEVIDPAIGAILKDHLLSLMGNMGQLNAEAIPYVTRATNNLLRAALMRSPETLNEAESEINIALIRRARQFIETNLMRSDLSPDVISAALGVSRARLYKLFAGHGGIMRQVQRQRLERAYDVLSDPDMPRERIADVAWRHGFTDEKYFSRLFRARFGCMPREAVEFARVKSTTGLSAATREQVVSPLLPEWLGARGEG